MQKVKQFFIEFLYLAIIAGTLGALLADAWLDELQGL